MENIASWTWCTEVESFLFQQMISLHVTSTMANNSARTFVKTSCQQVFKNPLHHLKTSIWVKPAFYGPCRKFSDCQALTIEILHNNGFVQKFPCFERPPSKHKAAIRKFCTCWFIRPFFDIFPLDLGYSALSLSVSVIVNAGTTQFLKKVPSFTNQPDQLCFAEKKNYVPYRDLHRCVRLFHWCNRLHGMKSTTWSFQLLYAAASGGRICQRSLY